MRFRDFREITIVLLILAAGGSGGCGSTGDGAGSYALDQSDPAAVVQAVFDVASGAEATVLGKLCDPEGAQDQDTRRICDQAAGFAPDGEFGMYFAPGRVDGEAVIEGDRAFVPFLFGPRGGRADTMELVMRDGKWYLLRF